MASCPGSDRTHSSTCISANPVGRSYQSRRPYSLPTFASDLRMSVRESRGHPFCSRHVARRPQRYSSPHDDGMANWPTINGTSLSGTASSPPSTRRRRWVSQRAQPILLRATALDLARGAAAGLRGGQVGGCTKACRHVGQHQFEKSRRSFSRQDTPSCGTQSPYLPILFRCPARRFPGLPLTEKGPQPEYVGSISGRRAS